MDMECRSGVTRSPEDSEGVEGMLRASRSSPGWLEEDEVVHERSSPMLMGRRGAKNPRLRKTKHYESKPQEQDCSAKWSYSIMQ